MIMGTLHFKLATLATNGVFESGLTFFHVYLVEAIFNFWICLHRKCATGWVVELKVILQIACTIYKPDFTVCFEELVSNIEIEEKRVERKCPCPLIILKTNRTFKNYFFLNLYQTTKTTMQPCTNMFIRSLT